MFNLEDTKTKMITTTTIDEDKSNAAVYSWKLFLETDIPFQAHERKIFMNCFRPDFAFETRFKTINFSTIWRQFAVQDQI